MKRLCKKCNILKSLRNFEKVNKIHRRHQCKECRNFDKRQMKGRSGNKLREKRLKQVYGLSLDDYDRMVQEQNGVCAICSKNNPHGPWSGKLVIDHCHRTGLIRGLLCDKCNKGLGQFDDNPELFLKAIEYLKTKG